LEATAQAAGLPERAMTGRSSQTAAPLWWPGLLATPQNRTRASLAFKSAKA